MVSLGIDQSYTQIGIAVTEAPNILLAHKSYSYKGLKSKSEKRLFVRKLIKYAISKYAPDIIVVQRIRTFSQGFISTAYIKATGALIGAIVDEAFPKQVWSADTRSWKSRICGSSKGLHAADKGVSVRFIRNKYGVEVNDDEADAICISLYGLGFKELLKKEE